ncbi:hypothetical protein R6Q59_011230 [Mikania micrantha]
MGDDSTIPTFKDPSTIYPGRHVFWIPTAQTSDDWVVNKKIYSAFRGVKSLPFKTIMLQYWRTPRKRLLGCYHTPYAQSVFHRRLVKYRSRSVLYLHSIDGMIDGEYPPKIITGGLPVTAFLNHFPEVVLDLRVHQGTPLVDLALECDLTCCMMLPIFYRYYSQCLGVVECSMTHPALLLPIFNDLKCELERNGLSMYHLEGRWPYKSIPGDLEPVKIEIEKGLKIACESHHLTLAQVWVSYTQMERAFLVKLSCYSVDSDDNPVKDFYDKCDVILGEGLAWKTLETHKPYFCENMYKLSENRGVLGILSANTKCTTCLVICLRNIHTGELDYTFEFFWPRRRNHLILLETLLLSLRNYLPSFKFASGEQLGDEIFVVDIENSSSKCESRLVKILQGNRLSETPQALKETRTLVGVKRKSIAGQSGLNQSNQYALTNINNPKGEDEEVDDDLAILAIYRNDAVLFFLPISSTFENLMEKLNKEFELDHDCKVEHEVLPGQWCSLVCLKNCRRMDIGLIKLRVLAVEQEVSWRWITNGQCFHNRTARRITRLTGHWSDPPVQPD